MTHLLDDACDFAEEVVQENPGDESGVIYDFDGPRQDRRRRHYTQEEIIAAIRAWNDAYGNPPYASDWNPAKRRFYAHNCLKKARWHLNRARAFEEASWPSVQTVRLHFGSLNAALVAAGFEPRAPGTQPRENGPDNTLRLEANEITRAEIASEARFRSLIGRILEAKQAGDPEAQQALWYEMAEVAVVLGDRAGAVWADHHNTEEVAA